LKLFFKTNLLLSSLLLLLLLLLHFFLLTTNFLAQNNEMSSIFQFLETQDQSSLNELYNSRWCCVAVLQSLSSTARQIVLRLTGIRVQVAESCIK
jgi:hypothetical protein